MPTPINPTADQADDYDQWFLAQVELAIQEADDPAAVWVSDEEARAMFAKKRAELQACIDQAKKGRAEE